MFIHSLEEGKLLAHGPSTVGFEQAHGRGYGQFGWNTDEEMNMVFVGFHLDDINLGVGAENVSQDRLKIFGDTWTEDFPTVFCHEDQMVVSVIGGVRLFAVLKFHASSLPQDGQEDKGAQGTPGLRHGVSAAQQIWLKRQVFCYPKVRCIVEL